MQTEEQKKEHIVLKGQTMYLPTDLKKELVKLRVMIRILAQASDSQEHCIDLEEYEQRMYVLNWLIEEIDFK
ncbi:hypothetical protein [Prevotella sp. P3-122]|jgi:hypothetical protein|uniref:hypothetical protein n=1 Tax=Prevotella sp. P3-122 TaxID=2024223 RepID=UPI000B963308|nr:hypothetical protein [Prevotella sp. P3-122]OYP59260.1 hypothetical protein CIL02_11315 [Prevotella sp. P3-122]